MNTDTESATDVAENTNAIASSIVSVQGEVAKFDQISAGLAAIEAAHPKDVIVANIATPAGMKLAEASWRAYRNPRLEVERARKAAKTPLLAIGKAIDSFAGELEARLRLGEDHYSAQITAEEQRRAAEKAEAARIEAERQQRHRANIEVIRVYWTRAQSPDMTSARLREGIAALAAQVYRDEEWEEFAAHARVVQSETIQAMQTLAAQLAAREVETARQEAIRIENERVSAELALERARIAAEAAEVRRQAEELAAQRAESERLQREAEARRKASQAAEERDASQRERDAFIAANPPKPLKKTQTASEPNPDTTTVSPRVGAMGAGQAADAAPAGGAATVAPQERTGPPDRMEPAMTAEQVSIAIAPQIIAGLDANSDNPAGYWLELMSCLAGFCASSIGDGASRQVVRQLSAQFGAVTQ